jgi:hypothetical protein
MISLQKYKLVIGCLSFVALAAALVLTSQFLNPKTKVTIQPTTSGRSVIEMDFIYPANYADSRILVGASQNIFVGKVLGQLGTRDRGIGLETQFLVWIIFNIKGSLQGTVTVDQLGGYENGRLYVTGDGSESTGYLLQPGVTYLLATRRNGAYDWYTLNSFPAATKVISTDFVQSDAALQLLAQKDSRVRELQAAYPNEVSLKADIAHNNTGNSYQSLHPAPMYVPTAPTSTATVATSSLPVSATTSAADGVSSSGTLYSDFVASGSALWAANGGLTIASTTSLSNSNIVVSDINSSSDLSFVALTFLNSSSTLTYDPTSTESMIQFNEYQMGKLTPDQDLETAAHELGHALGLDHSFVGDIMNYYIATPGQTTLGAQDVTDYIYLRNQHA